MNTLQGLADEWAMKGDIKPGQRVLARDSHGHISPGEYTGFSTITGMHHVSFYNGDTRKFKDLKDITPAK